MKKMLLATALALLITGCASTDASLFKIKLAAVAPKETITSIISSFLELGRRKLSMQPKFVAAQKIQQKQKPSKHSKWIARFYYFRHLYLLEARVYCSPIIAMSCPSIWATFICTAH